MSDPLVFVITDAGRAALPNPDNTGVTSVKITQIGVSASVVAANASMVALPGEIKRLATFGGSAVADDTIHVTIRDETGDAYSLRSFALYLDTGVLFGLYGQAAVISEKTTASTLLLSADFKTADIDATVIEFGSTDFQNPPATETVQGVLALATNAEALAGVNPSKGITPKTLLFAFTTWIAAQFSDVWRASNDGAGSGLDAGLFAGQLPAYYTAIATRQGYTSANKAGDMFTGPVYFQDGNFYATLSGGNPAFALGPGASIIYDRTNGALNINIGGAARFGLSASGLTIPGSFTSTGPATVQGGGVWHSANDGAGSGLDAGLLGGQLPAYYMAIAARQGYTSANKAGDTFTGNVGFGDSLYYLGLSGVSPIRVFDSNDYDIYDRVNNTYSIVIGATGRLSLTSAGMFLSGSLSVSGAATVQGGLVWHSGNDGAGSGMDTDLFDGQDSSFYTNITARLGYTPLNQASYSAGDVLAKLVTVDGAGSGLDAGLLAGQASAFYTDIPNRLGYVPLNQASYNATDIRTKLVTVDGSGSGVDADLLDGLQAAAFALLGLSNAVLPAGSNANGTWFKIGNLIIQCGMRATISPDTTATVTYPLPLTANAPFFYIAGTRLSSFDSGADSFGQIIGTPGLASMTVDCQRVNNSATIDVPWLIMAWG